MAFPAFGSAGTEQEVNSTSNPQTLNLPYPSGLAANDILLALAMNRSSSSAISDPAGFSAGDSRQQGNVLGKWSWKRATGSESGTLAIERTAGTNLFYALLVRFSGALETGTPYDLNAQDGAGAAATFVPPDLDPATAEDRLMISLMFIAGDAIALADFTGGTATVTERAHVDTPTGADGTIHVADAQHGTDALFDFGSQDPDANTYQTVYFTLALRPAAGVAASFLPPRRPGRGLVLRAERLRSGIFVPERWRERIATPRPPLILPA